jgi:hypothetical protein
MGMSIGLTRLLNTVHLLFPSGRRRIMYIAVNSRKTWLYSSDTAPEAIRWVTRETRNLDSSNSRESRGGF